MATPSQTSQKLVDKHRPGADAFQAPRSIRGVSGIIPPAQRHPSRISQVDSKAPATPSKKRRQFWTRKLRFTREGKYFLGITMGVGFAAINTGNNLLYLLLGLMLSLIIVSGVMSEISLRHLTVKRRLPLRAQVGRAHVVEIEVFNHKQQVPSYAIEVEDLRAEQPADKRCFFLKISPTSTQIAAYRRTPARRGREAHVGFRVATRFPFGLFEKSREIFSDGELIIYPKIFPVALPQHLRGDRTGESGPLGRGHGEEIYALREMREGDDPRDIYWRKSTNRHQIVLKERAYKLQRKAALSIDVFRKDKLTAQELERQNESFEKRVSEVASFAVAHLRRGDHVTLTTSAGDRVSSDKTQGLDPLLRFLALLEQQEHTQDTSPGHPTKKHSRGQAA